MNKIKYIEIKMGIPEKLLYDQIYSIIHSLMGIKKAKLGLAFPDYKIENNTLGKRIRIFGSVDDLKLILNNYTINELEEQNYITTSLNDFPSKYNKVLFVRDRTNDNYRNIKNSRKEKPISYPFVKIKSSSSRQTFYLNIKKIETETDAPFELNFNSYGLGSKEKNSWIPDF